MYCSLYIKDGIGRASGNRSDWKRQNRKSSLRCMSTVDADTTPAVLVVCGHVKHSIQRAPIKVIHFAGTYVDLGSHI
jgi:hypothetical protein